MVIGDQLSRKQTNLAEITGIEEYVLLNAYRMETPTGTHFRSKFGRKLLHQMPSTYKDMENTIYGFEN